MNKIVTKYYKEDLKPEEESFKFRKNHINMLQLFPAFENKYINSINSYIELVSFWT